MIPVHGLRVLPALLPFGHRVEVGSPVVCNVERILEVGSRLNPIQA